MRIEDELRHVRRGPEHDERPEWVVVDYIVECDGDARTVLMRCREVLGVVLDVSTSSPWPSLNEWRSILPRWFVDASADERSAKEVEEWNARLKTLPRDEQLRADWEDRWSLGEWLPSFAPDGERWWNWWDGVVEDPNTLKITVEAQDFPLAWDDLRWLLRAAGATKVYESGWDTGQEN